MTVHIERIVTDISILPDSGSLEGEPADPRWTEIQRIEAALKRSAQMGERLRAEGFDD